MPQLTFAKSLSAVSIKQLEEGHFLIPEMYNSHQLVPVCLIDDGKNPTNSFVGVCQRKYVHTRNKRSCCHRGGTYRRMWQKCGKIIAKILETQLYQGFQKNGVSLSRWNQGFDSPWDYQAETLGISTISRVF